MKKVIVTGATSLFGTCLINTLLQSGYFVYAIIRNDSTKRGLLPYSTHLKIIECEMNAYHNLTMFIDQSCDAFIHLAWEWTRGPNRDNQHIQEANYANSLNAVEAAKVLGCMKFIVTGSQAEYGAHEEKIKEETICDPKTAYGMYKFRFFCDACEQCQKFGMRFKEPRIFSLYGPGDYENTMVISTIRKMLKNEDCPFTLATQMWDFLYINDAVDAVICLLEKECDDGAYNIASGASRPLREFIEDMYRICDSQSRLLFGQIPFAQSGKVNLWADVSKMKSQTGWIPQTDFSDGIAKVISYCKRTEIS